MKNKLPLLLTLVGLGSAKAALIVHYDFDTIDGTTVANEVTPGSPGTLVGTNAGPGGYTAGPTGFGTAYDFTNGSNDDSKLSTGLTPNDLGITSGPYTMTAWIQLNTNATDDQDNMVFGGVPDNDSGQLHNGFRDERPHQGHWGSDTTDDVALANDSATWHHVAWTYTGAAGTQEIFVDGVSVISGSPRNGVSGGGTEIAIGWTGRGANDAFNGKIDDVRIYDEVLTATEILALMLPADDADGDGLSDDDEVNIHGTNPNDADSDDDGMEDGDEVAAGLDPNSDVGDDGAAGDPDGDNLTNIDEVNTHQTNPLEADTDGDLLNDDVELNVHSTSPIDADSDDDNLTDGQEINDTLTDPNDADSDDDTINDGVEIANMLNPNVSTGDDGADGDPDGDTLGNKEELETHGTDPQVADTDDDGLNDNVELEAPATDPNNADSDGDGLTDGEEVNQYLTDPNNTDSDGDLVPDGEEVAGNSAPNNANETPASTVLLTHYYTFDEDGSDSVGMIDGTLEDGAMIVAGVVGNALDVAGGTQHALMTNPGAGGDTAVIPVGTSYSISLWAKRDLAAVDGWMIGQGDTAGADLALHLGFRANNQVAHAFWSDDLGANGVAQAADTVDWHHWVFTYNAESNLQAIYVDGGGPGNSFFRTSTGDFLGSGTNNFWVGRRRDGQNFDGQIDDVQVYAGVLNGSEVKDLFDSPGSAIGGPATGIEVTDISYDGDSGDVSLTFSSRPGQTYSLLWSPDMQDGPDYRTLNNQVEADAVADTTTVTFAAPRPENDPGGSAVPKAFFFIRQN